MSSRSAGFLAKPSPPRSTAAAADIEKPDAVTVDDALVELGLIPVKNETIVIVNKFFDDASPPSFVSRHPLKATAKVGGVIEVQAFCAKSGTGKNCRCVTLRDI